MSYRPAKMLNKYVVRKVAAPSLSFAPQAIGYSPQAVARHLAGGAEDPEMCPTPAAVRGSDFTVRPAGKGDLAAAVELESVCFGTGGFSLTKRQLQYLQRRPTALFLVAEQGGTVIGQGVALVRQHRSGHSGRIYSLAVHPDSRGQGVGDALLRSLVDQLASRGVRRVYLEVDQANGAALRLYERFGFRRLGTLDDYYGPGKAAAHMVLEIKSVAMVA
jgi:ribosomal-protein-alanine N-acetyltransferase